MQTQNGVEMEHMLKLQLARDNSETRDEVDTEELGARYTVDYEAGLHSVNVAGRRVVNTITLVGGRLYTEEGCEAYVGDDGELYIDEEQENKYFL